MKANPAQVIVTTDGDPRHAVHGVSVHHRDFPELRGEGGSAVEAALRLAELLKRTLDNAPSDWRRDIVERAIVDVRAFAEQNRTAAPSGPSSALAAGNDGRA